MDTKSGASANPYRFKDNLIGRMIAPTYEIKDGEYLFVIKDGKRTPAADYIENNKNHRLPVCEFAKFLRELVERHKQTDHHTTMHIFANPRYHEISVMAITTIHVSKEVGDSVVEQAHFTIDPFGVKELVETIKFFVMEGVPGNGADGDHSRFVRLSKSGIAVLLTSTMGPIDNFLNQDLDYCTDDHGRLNLFDSVYEELRWRQVKRMNKYFPDGSAKGKIVPDLTFFYSSYKFNAEILKMLNRSADIPPNPNQ